VTPDSLALEQEIERHPRRLAALWSAESALRRQSQIGRERWPELEVEVGVRRFLEANESAWVTGLSLGLPLWDHKGGALREARELAQAADADAVSVERELRSELTGLLAGLGESSQRLALYRDRILPSARDALDLARKGFEGGKFGYLDLLGAQTSLLDVEKEYLETLVSYDESVGRLESLLGREPGNGLLPESP
jgi:outer membrane protein, heavy metal efflux system